MDNQNPYQPPESQVETKTPAIVDDSLSGIGGWLILVAIGVVFGPIRLLSTTVPVYTGLFEDGTWKEITTPGTDSYNPLWQPVLIAEMGINLGLFIALLIMAYLFFSKKRGFPKLYIGIMIFSLVFILVDAYAINIIRPDIPIFDPQTVSEVFRQCLAMIIWIPYMMVSKRVQATFVN